MADVGGDGASLMGSFDPSAFTGRDEDLILPGDSLFGFSAAAGIGGSPDVGGGEGDGSASFQGGSALMLFPPASASFQANASYSVSRGVVGGGCLGGSKEGNGTSDGTEPPLSPPPTLRKMPSLHESLKASIDAAASREAANAAASVAAAAAAAKSTRTKVSAGKPKRSSRSRWRAGDAASGSTKPCAGGGIGADNEFSNCATAGACDTASAGASRRPPRNLRRPRQESKKETGQAASAAACPFALQSSGEVPEPSTRRAAAGRKGVVAAVQTQTSTTTRSVRSDTATATIASGGERGRSPCRPPLRRTGLAHTAKTEGASGSDVAKIGLPTGLELIPGFEDTIDSNFLTTLLQKSPGSQPGDLASVFTSADSHGLEAGSGGRSGGEDHKFGFGSNPEASLGFTAGLLLGCDSQPSAAAVNVAFDPVNAGVDVATATVASPTVKASPFFPPAPKPLLPASSKIPLSPRATLAPPRASEAPRAAVPEPLLPSASAGELLPATSPLVTLRDDGTEQPERDPTAPLCRTTVRTPTPAAVPAAALSAAATPSKASSKAMQSARERQLGSRAHAATSPCADGVDEPAYVEVVGLAMPASAGSAVAPPPTQDARATIDVSDELNNAPSEKAPETSSWPPSLSLADRRGPAGDVSAPVATVGEGAGGVSPPVAEPTREAAAQTAVQLARPLPRKVSLRFAPRDVSTEDKLSKHGYIPFQKLTAPLWKPLEAVFKFMMKKWSEVEYSDLNSIRIVFDVTEAEEPASVSLASSSSAPVAARFTPRQTIVWSAVHSKESLSDLVSSLPESALERVRDEEALDLTYTFSVGPVSPPPPRGSAPWDTSNGTPAAATAAVAAAATSQRLSPPPTEPLQTTQRPVSSPVYPPALQSPPLVSERQAVVGEPEVVPRIGLSTDGGVFANAVAEGMPPPSPAPLNSGMVPGLLPGLVPGLAAGPATTGGINQAAIGLLAGGAGGLANINLCRPPQGVVPGDISNSVLKGHFKQIRRLLKRQGMLSPPPANHFLPGGLFARMLTAAVANRLGPAIGAGAAAAPAGFAPGTPATILHPVAAKGAQEAVDADFSTGARGPSAETSEGGLNICASGGGNGGDSDGSGGGDSGYEDVGGGGESGADANGGRRSAGGVMAEVETCVSLFAGNEVDFLVDPSPPTGMGDAKGGERGGQGEVGTEGVARPVERVLPLPRTGGEADAAAAAPATAGGGVQNHADEYQAPVLPTFSGPGKQGTTAPSAPLAASEGSEAEPHSSSSLPEPSVTRPLTESAQLRAERADVVAQSAAPWAPPPPPPTPTLLPGDCALMGEETCMAFLSGTGIELPVEEASLPPPLTETRKAKGVAAQALDETCGDSAGSAVQPTVHTSTKTVSTTRVSAASVAHSSEGGAAGPEGGSSHPPIRAAEEPESLSSTGGGAGADERDRAAVQPFAQPPAGGDGATADGATHGLEADMDTPNEPVTTRPLLPSPRIDGSAPAVGVEGARHVSADAPQWSEQRHHGGELAEVRSEVVAQAAERVPSESLPSAPEKPAQSLPPVSSLPPSVFKMGTLPSRARAGRVPSPLFAAAAAASPSAAVAAGKPPAKQTIAGPSRSPAQSPPRWTPVPADGREAPLSDGYAVESGRARSSSTACKAREQELEPAAEVSTASAESLFRVAVAARRERKAKAQVAMQPNAAASTATKECKGDGGGGAVTVAAPPTLTWVQEASGTALAPPPPRPGPGAAGAKVAAEDALIPQAGGRRNLTRSHSNGGDPVSFVSSGGGDSSRPEEEGQRVPKRARRDAPCRDSRALSDGASSSPAAAVAEKNGGERRRCSSFRESAGEGKRENRYFPTVGSSGELPTTGATSPAAAAPAVSAPTIRAATPRRSAAEDAPRPFSCASAKNEESKAEASVEGSPPSPPPPPLARVGGLSNESKTDGAYSRLFPSNPAEEAFRSPAAARYRDWAPVIVRPGAAQSTAVRPSMVSTPAVRARPFAFAAAARKGVHGELLPPGEPATSVAADTGGRTAVSPRPSGLSQYRGANSAPVDSCLPPENSGSGSGRPGPERGEPPPAALPNSGSAGASTSLLMSPEEVQAEYSEAWSSLPSCFWDDAALWDGGGAGGGGISASGKHVAVEGPVTRWLALPHAGPALGGTAVAPAITSSPPAASAAPADVPSLAAARASSSTAPASSGDGRQANGGEEWDAGAAVGFSQREARQPSRASFCTAFASSRGSSGSGGVGAARAATAPAGSTARATEEVRSLPTLIRLGRSMTKGVAPAEEDNRREEEMQVSVATTAAAVGDAEHGRENRKVAGGESDATVAPVSVPAVAAAATGRPLGGPGGEDGGQCDAWSACLAGGRRKRPDAGEGDGNYGSTCGGEDGGRASAATSEVAAAASVATALPKRRAKKKGRITPVLVSSLSPDTFGTIVRTFSGNLRA